MSIVYVAYHRRDWEAVQDDDDAPRPDGGNFDSGVVPRVGDFVQSGDHWWRVEVVAWSSHQPPGFVERGVADYHAWADIVVTPVDDDPRQ